MKQIEVKILQQSYTLACKEGQQERLTEAVRLVDDAMTRIHDAGKVRARERIAVLAALNLAFELGDIKQEAASALLEHQTSLLNQAEELSAQSDASNTTEADTQALRSLVTRLDQALSPPLDQA